MSMTKREKIKFYATAPRAYAATISQIEDGDFVQYWVGKLRGRIVSYKGQQYKFKTKDEAIECARRFRQSCRDDAERLGIAL